MSITTEWEQKKMRLSVYSGIVTGILVCVLFIALPVSAQNLMLNSVRNCDANAIIDCGALSVSELQQKYTATPSVQTIYGAFNISSTDITNLSTTAVAGTVTKSGSVIVGGQTVATNALTAGRQNIVGSTPVTMGGVTFFERPPSVSFVSDNLAAFVAMSNGQFQFAILASCGNPVKATPVVVAKPVPKPTPKPTVTPKPTPTPAAPVVQQQQQQQQVVVVQQPVQTQTVVEQVAATPAPPAQTQTQALPNTGPGSVIGLFAGTTTLGTLVSRFIMKRRASGV